MVQPLLLVAFIAEGLSEYFLGHWLKGNFMRVGVALVAVVISVAYGFDLFAGAGLVSSVPYLGSALTGLVAARGSDFAHQVYNRLRPGG